MARWQPAERNARYIKARAAGRPVVVTEGDSWFDYPQYRNIIDLLDDQKRFALKRLEFSGDTVANMVGSGGSTSGVASLETVVLDEHPRFLLFSGGGNDIVGDEITDGVREYDPTQTPEWHLDTPVWRRLIDGVELGYATLVDTIGPLVPIFAHGYDYVIPADEPVRYDGWSVAGPWLWPELARKNIPDAMMVAIGAVMIDRFNEILADLASIHETDGFFAHLDLRGTLKKKDWENEIHPTEDGFAKITATFVSELDAKLGPTIAAHDSFRMGIA
jgi:hypothetical protein